METNVLKQIGIKRGKLQKRPPIMWVMSAIFLVYALLLLFPMAFALNSSLKNGDQDFTINLTKITTKPRFANFFESFFELEVSGITFFDMSLNSLWFSVGTTLLNVFSSMCLAYGVSKYKFKGKEFIYNFVLIIMIFPVFGTLPARYKLYSNLGFIDSPLILLAYTGAFDGQFLVLYAFFKNVDWSYAESAFIEGASHTKVFAMIMFPMALPAVSALMVSNFIASWNNYADVLLYLPKLPTLSAGIQVFNTKMMYQADRPLFYAGMLISLMPVMIVYYTMQKFMLKLDFEGGLKG